MAEATLVGTGVLALNLVTTIEGRPAQTEKVIMLPSDEASKFGMQDFPPHAQERHTHHAASRSEQRKPLPKPTTAAPTPATIYPAGSTRAIGQAMLLREGWSEGEWNCLDALWTHESQWETTVMNSSSGAYGIPQALPGEKMATFGSDWRTNPVTQIAWGLSYIRTQYGNPCNAEAHEEAYNFY